MDRNFNYEKAEADLHDSGCPYPEEIYSRRTEDGINDFMRENGLNPDNYYDGPSDSGGQDSGGCYLTSACVRSRGLADNCEELTVLRNFRDTYLTRRESGRADIAYYYRTAQDIVAAIDSRVDAEAVWTGLYESLVTPCVKLIKQGKPEEAYLKYKSEALKLAEIIRTE